MEIFDFPQDDGQMHKLIKPKVAGCMARCQEWRSCRWGSKDRAIENCKVGPVSFEATNEYTVWAVVDTRAKARGNPV